MLPDASRSWRRHILWQEQFLAKFLDLSFREAGAVAGLNRDDSKDGLSRLGMIEEEVVDVEDDGGWEKAEMV